MLNFQMISRGLNNYLSTSNLLSLQSPSANQGLNMDFLVSRDRQLNKLLSTSNKSLHYDIISNNNPSPFNVVGKSNEPEKSVENYFGVDNLDGKSEISSSYLTINLQKANIKYHPALIVKISRTFKESSRILGVIVN